MPEQPVYIDTYSPCPACGLRKATICQELNNVGIGHVVTCWCGARSRVMPTEEEAVIAWEGMPRDGVWTPDMPTERGWRWMRTPYFFSPVVVYVIPVDAENVELRYYDPYRQGFTQFNARKGENVQWSSRIVRLPAEVHEITREDVQADLELQRVRLDDDKMSVLRQGWTALLTSAAREALVREGIQSIKIDRS